MDLSKNVKLKIFLKYCLYFFLFFVCFKAGLKEQIYPFGFAIYFGLIWCNQNVFGISGLFLLAGFLSNFSLYLLLGNAIFIVLFLLIYGIHYKLKKSFKYLHIIIYSCLCNLPILFIKFFYLKAQLYALFVEFFLGLLFTFVCIKLFESICIRGIVGKRTNLENSCFLVFVTILFCGISTLSFYEIDLIKFFIPIGLLILAYIYNFSGVMLMAGCMGVGAILGSDAFQYLTLSVIYALAVCLFKTKNKYISSVAIILSEVFCGFYLNLYGNYQVLHIVPVLVAVVLFMLLPYKILDKFAQDLQMYGLTQSNVINRNRELLYKRLVKLSDVFSEMNKVFRTMISGGVANSSAKKMMLDEVKIKTCSNCPKLGKCYKIHEQETINNLNHMIEIGVERGKVNLLDVPTAFAGKCEKLNLVVSCINDLITQLKNYAGLMNNIDASKVMLAEQLLGVSYIMRDLSQEVKTEVNFEKGIEKKIIDELLYNNIICSDALVFEGSDQIMSVTIAVRNEDSQKSIISKIVSKICKTKMSVCEESSSQRAGFKILTLKTTSKFDCLFGVATKTKTGSVASGDCYSVIKINDSKYLFAVCDGMGSGTKAQSTSSTAIGLLENFYKAGFEKEIIMSSVNKLLTLGREDVFSALDLCVLDVREGIGDFIKMGAPESFIKHIESIDTVSIEALPLGIIQNVETKAKQIFVTAGDYIVMFTDGISDGYKNIEELSDYINNLTNFGPQEMANQILEHTLAINGNVAKDDMTVVVVRIFNN